MAIWALALTKTIYNHITGKKLECTIQVTKSLVIFALK